MKNRDLMMARRIAARVAEEGGCTYLVGGYVRDRLLGKENKDIDIEVHGIYPETLERILGEFGHRTEMGADFGIFGLSGYGLDIAMPRKEEAVGRGHRDFKVWVDPFLGPQRAARRRDFTVNALMEDVLTGEVIDCYGGVEDLKRGVLRHVNTETFVEDPLRVLRAAQFAARFEFGIAEETVALARTMDLTALARERILGELQKALLKARRPSAFFEEMRRMEQLSVWFPEAERLIGVKQDPEYHPEGDVWTHTMLVLDEAAKLREQAEQPLGFMLAALTHDFGKIIATQPIGGRLRSPGHETQGLPLVKTFLRRITNETKLIRYVLNLCELHMRPYQLAAQEAGKKATNRLFDEAVDPMALILFSGADHLGRTGAVRKEAAEAFLLERLKDYRETMAKPYVMGADLIKAGLKPGPEFSDLLNFAHRLRLANVEKEAALKHTLALARQKEEAASERAPASAGQKRESGAETDAGACGEEEEGC